MNIVLVVFDSWRKDCFGVHGSPPWGKVHTPNLDRFAEESLVMTRAYPEVLPTIPVRRSLYTGRRGYPFHNTDPHLPGPFGPILGWRPIPEEQPTLSELLGASQYRTGLITDVYHMFRPGMNYWRGFQQWTYLRGQELDPERSGPRPTQEEIDYLLPREVSAPFFNWLAMKCILTMRERNREEDYFAPKIFREASLWLEQNWDADKFFLTVESFNPHMPWLVPEHYRKMYLEEDGREQVMSLERDISDLDPKLLQRTQANYSGAVTMCDRWFGYFMDTLRVQGMLDNTMVIMTSDHGHSIGDQNFMGKRGYPSTPEVFDVPLMIRFPGAEHGGTTSGMFVQHHDISAMILEAAGVEPPPEMDGISFLGDVLSGKDGKRDHVTVAWNSAVTVINDRWWLNCKVDGTGVLLYDLKETEPFAKNVAEENSEAVNELYALAKADATGGFPDWLLERARSEKDAPGSSDMVARA